MLSKKDLQKIGTLVDERLGLVETRLSSKFDERFKVAEDRLTSKFDERFKVAEDRLTSKFDERFKVAEDRLSSKFDEKFEIVKRDLRNEVVDAIQKDAAKVRSDIAEFKDEILSEIVDLRSDMAVTEGYGDRLEEHEERIEKLERKVFHAAA